MFRRDVASLEDGGPAFRNVGEIMELRLIDVSGRLSPRARALLEQKVAVLGRDAGIEVASALTGLGLRRPRDDGSRLPSQQALLGSAMQSPKLVGGSRVSVRRSAAEWSSPG